MKRYTNRLTFLLRVLLGEGVAFVLLFSGVGCSHTVDGGPEVMPKKYPGGGAANTGGSTEAAVPTPPRKASSP